MSEKAQTPHPEKQLNVEMDDITAQGIYSNLASISYNESEFIFDFLFVQPQSPKAAVRSRVITSPKHAKRISELLTKNIADYEGRYSSLG